ncbi:MAG: DUF294 nucleotidyltransferase-like domain-containing protein [Xanthomonadaceae bacterium]|jgi:CBS domain-containing protein|nr:DUF294 nucleotidyltransferase-like domain-containing protein [Xanthomonadaceae bacterium]
MTIVLFDFSQPPFDSLIHQERQHVEKSIDIQFFPEGHPIIKYGEPVEALYVLIKGIVKEAGSVDKDAMLTAYTENDCFDTRSLIDGKAGTTLIASEDSIVACLPREVIFELIDGNPLFGAFFYQDVAKRLAALAHRPHQQALQSMLMAKVEQAFIREPSWLASNATVWDAARLMRDARTSSILVRNEAGEAGIYTQSDLRNFVIGHQNADECAVADLANYGLYSVEADDSIYHAMLIMTRHTIQRVVVTRRDEIIGILDQVDLLSFLNDHSYLVSAQIERARSIGDLHAAWRNTDQLITMLHDNGVRVTLIANLVGELRHKLYARIFELIAPIEILENTCLLALGSEGRGEQILKTDQDNALIIEDGFSHPDLERVCQQFNDTLIQFGYPPCPGGIMVRNPQWRNEVSGYRRLINSWLDSASGENMMSLAIWVDAYPVCGKYRLFEELRDYWLRNMSHNAAFLARFVFPIEHFDIPLDLFSRLVTDKGRNRNQLDLKKGGIFPLVHGIRSLTLEMGLKQRNSYQRIDALIQHQAIPAVLAQDLAESLAFLQSLQLKYGLQKQVRGQSMDNLIDPGQLTTLERDLLKDTFAVVKRFKQYLRHHYRLNAL